MEYLLSITVFILIKIGKVAVKNLIEYIIDFFP